MSTYNDTPYRRQTCLHGARRLLCIAALLLWAIGGMAAGEGRIVFRQFFNLTAQEVAIDTLLPRFHQAFPLTGAWRDSAYQVSIDYPEYVAMTPDEVSRYRQLSGNDALPAQPVIDSQTGVARRQASFFLSFTPLVQQEGEWKKLVSFRLTVTSRPVARPSTRAEEGDTLSARYAAHSVLATGRWAKIRVPETGVYQLTDALVRKAGFSDLSRVRIYGYGGALQPEVLSGAYLAATDDLKEVPSCYVGGKRLFHAVGPVSYALRNSRVRTRNPYSTHGYYFLTEAEGEPLAVDSTTFVDSFYPSSDDYHSLYEEDNYAWFHGGRNLYDGQLFGQGVSHDYHLSAPCAEATLIVVLSYDAPFQATISINGNEVGSATPPTGTFSGSSFTTSYINAAATTFTFSTNALNIGDNTVTIRQESGGNLRIDHITLVFPTPREAPRLSASIPVPEYVYNITNQDHHADPQCDMVIIIPTSQKLKTQAERLKALHEKYDRIRINIVPADELYNEFSSGTPDVNAYRRYLKMLYDRGAATGDQPSHVLLFGDAVWDNRMLTSDCRALSPDDYLLCYESENSFSEVLCYVADDFITLLDDGEGGRIVTADQRDMAVGRLPISTEAEARLSVNKIESYISNATAGNWQNLLCFMGDDGNQNMHMRSADIVAEETDSLYPSFNIKKIYWDAYARTSSSTGYAYPDVENLIHKQMQQGALIMNYTGHGQPSGMAHERVTSLSDFEVSSSMRLPLWITASCDIMPFDGTEENVGETAMLNPTGGAIAFYGTTRTVYAYYNQYMNQAFMKEVLAFGDDGRTQTIGTAAMKAKNALVAGSDQTENKLQYSLLGDPALRLAQPENVVYIDSINGQPATQVATLSAGSIATISGHLAAPVDGVINLLVKGERQTIICRLNDVGEADVAFSYEDRQSTIYNGSDSINGGRFSISFAVPKDISYSTDNGLMLFHAVADGGTYTAHGQCSSFVLNGSSITGDDGIGPSIYCYLNSPTFMNGGRVNPTPYFYAELSDKDGINGGGDGIGHTMELIIDGQMQQTYSLNDYFQFDFGDYRRGTVGFPLPEMTAGNHHLFFRAWDVLNNPSTCELDFEVVPSLQPSISSVICTQNPATTSTSFIINHDRTGSSMDVTLEVFDTSGRTLWRHTETGWSTDNTYTIDWNLTVDGGVRLRTGVYFYRVLISTSGSTKASKAGKLIILKE